LLRKFLSCLTLHVTSFINPTNGRWDSFVLGPPTNATLRGLVSGVTKRCRLCWLTNGALEWKPNCGERGSTAVHTSPNA
jgi:hypothetical protein